MKSIVYKLHDLQHLSIDKFIILHSEPSYQPWLVFPNPHNYVFVKVIIIKKEACYPTSVGQNALKSFKSYGMSKGFCPTGISCKNGKTNVVFSSWILRKEYASHTWCAYDSYRHVHCIKHLTMLFQNRSAISWCIFLSGWKQSADRKSLIYSPVSGCNVHTYH